MARGEARGEAAGGAGTPGERRVGRPPRISRDDIAAAAHRIGLADLTLKAVADELGVSVAALYHHVDGKEDLLRLAAEHAMSSRTLPVDAGQHWARWLFEWATHERRSFVADPGLLEQYLDGGISVERMVDTQEDALALLVRQGFTPAEAMGAFQLISACAVGGAVNEIRERRAQARGHSTVAELRSVLEGRPGDELPTLRQVLGSDPPALVGTDEQVVEVLVGLALRRGDDPDEVRAAIAPAPGRDR